MAADTEPGLREPGESLPAGLVRALNVALDFGPRHQVVDEQAGGAVVEDAFRPLGPKVKHGACKKSHICSDGQSQTSFVKDENQLWGQRLQRHQKVLALLLPTSPLDAHPRLFQIAHLHDHVISSQNDEYIANVDLIDGGVQKGRPVLDWRSI